MKHTPTPWNWNSHHQLSGETECLKGAGVKTVLSWGRRPNHEGVEYTYISVSKDDAAFIVEACNAYERLKLERNALREVANAVTVGYRVGAIAGKLAKSTFELAEAGIALCEGGAE